MRILEHFDVLGDAIGGCIVTDHLCWEMNQFAGVKAPTVGIKMCEEVGGRDGGVEGVGMAEVTVPHLLYCVADEFGGRAFGGFIGGIVADTDGVFCFLPGVYDGGCIIRDEGVSRGSWWDGERGAPGGCIRCGGLNQADEVVGAILVIGDAKEERVQDLA